jgi:hypothetical protein
MLLQVIIKNIMNFNTQKGKTVILFFILFLVSKVFYGITNINTNKEIAHNIELSLLQDSLHFTSSQNLKIKIINKIKEKVGVNKGTALLILLLTGPLGGHRIYLGTSIYVPIAYTLTIGGGFGILPLLDAFVIIFTDDLSKYVNNSQVIMWINNN